LALLGQEHVVVRPADRGVRPEEEVWVSARPFVHHPDRVRPDLVERHPRLRRDPEVDGQLDDVLLVVRAALEDLARLEGRKDVEPTELDRAAAGRELHELLLVRIPTVEHLADAAEPGREVEHALALDDQPGEDAAAVGERPERVHQIGAAVSWTDSIVSPTKSASWRCSISQRRRQRAKRRSMNRSSAAAGSGSEATSSARTTASSIAIAAPCPTCGEVACAASPISTTRPRNHGVGTSSDSTGR